MSIDNKAVKAIQEVVDQRIRSSNANRASTHLAEVLDIDAQGTTWVHIFGGAERTPAARTLAHVEKGDLVTVSFEDGVYTVIGSASSPSASQRQVMRVASDAAFAMKDAETAKAAADDALASASTAAQAADEAKASAESAQADAAEAADAADAAQADAVAAGKAANSALDQLGVVQDVVGVLNYVAEHGGFVRTHDQEIAEGKVYFTLDSQTGDYVPVVDPQASALSTYYEVSEDYDDVMGDFIMAHLAVTSRGLWVLPSGMGSSTTPASGESQADSDARQGANYKMLLSNDGTYIYDGNGDMVIKYGQNIEPSTDRPFYIGDPNSTSYILFTPASGGNPAHISIGGGVTIGSDKTLSELLTADDITVTQNPTQTGYDVDIAGNTFSLVNGSQGPAGTSVTVSKVEYATSTSESQPSSGWSTTAPSTVAEGSWLWVKTTYSDGTDSVIRAKQGKSGTNGTSYYTHVRYSESADGTGHVATPTSATKYIGVYTGTSSSAPSSKTSYKWSKYVGANGASSYVHTAWANSADGKTDFSTTVSAGKKYLGVYSDSTQADSTSPSAYSWSLIKGDTGAQGPQGPQGEQGVSVTNVTSTNNTADGGTSVVTVTLSDGTTKTFNVKNGSKGSTGATGATAEWYHGTALTHTSGTATLATSSTSGVVVGSMYLNTSTSLCYKCTAISGTTATWTYAGNLTDGVIDNINVGGRNLLLQSQLFGTAGKTNRIVGKYNNNELLVSRADGFNEIQANANFRGISVYADSMGFAVGEKLILSTNVRSDSTVGTNLQFYCMAFDASGTRIQTALLHLKTRATQGDGAAANIYVYYSFPAGAEERIIVEITWLQAAQDLLDAGGNIRFTIQATSSDWSKGNVAMWAPKLERGNVATDWTPAPEDMEAAIEEAAKVAGNYIVETATNDVWIHSEDHGPNSSGVATADTYGWRIGSVFELVRAGVTYIKMWVDNVAKLMLGVDTSGHVLLDSTGMEVFAGTNGADSVAKFGSETRIGKSGGARFVTNASSLQAYDSSNAKYFKVSSSGLTWGTNTAATTTQVSEAAKRTYVSIRATAVDFNADTATLQATLYVDGAAKTSGVTYAWLKDGTAMSGETSRTLSVTTAKGGLEHAYSCTATY